MPTWENALICIGDKLENTCKMAISCNCLKKMKCNLNLTWIQIVKLYFYSLDFIFCNILFSKVL